MKTAFPGRADLSPVRRIGNDQSARWGHTRPTHFRGSRFARILGLVILGLALIGTVVAQRYRSSRRAPPERTQPPPWSIDPQFKRDVFTFTRIRYDSSATWYGSQKWAIDYPDADLNLSSRLQQLTSMKVDPGGVDIQLTDPTLFDYPFIYIVEPGDPEMHLGRVGRIKLQQLLV